MNRHGWRFIALFSFYLLPTIGAEAQKRVSSEVVRERFRDAAAEIARGDREATQRVREALGEVPPNTRFGVDEVAAAMRASLAPKKLIVSLERQGNQQLFRLDQMPSSGLRYSERLGTKEARERKRVDALVGRMLNGVLRRDQIIKEIGAKEEVSLEGRRLEGQSRSELEAYLERAGVPHYADMASSFDANTIVKEITLTREVSLLRIFGGNSKPTGSFLFCCLESPTNTSPSARAPNAPFSRWTDASGLALPPDNLAQQLAVVTLPIGTRLLIGTVADYYFKDAEGNSKSGGSTQIVLHEGKVDFPHQRYTVRETEADASDIVVKFENNRILRFKPGPAEE